MNRLSVLLAGASFAAFACAATSPANGEWLVIAGSNRLAAPAVAIKKNIQPRFPTATIVASNDCPGLAPDLFLTVATMASDRSAADAALQRLKPDIPDTYIRECKPKDNTMLAFGLALVDPSIERVPLDAVNWSDQDRVSSLIKLPEKGYLWIRRRYVADRNDPREGRRESVLFFEDNPRAAVELQSDCADPHFRQRGPWIVFECARGVAADSLLHETIVMDTTSGKEVYGVMRCRAPEFLSDSVITCQSEKVGPDGELALQTIRPVFR